MTDEAVAALSSKDRRIEEAERREQRALRALRHCQEQDEARNSDAAEVERLVREAASDPINHAYNCAFSTSFLHDEPCDCWLRAALAATAEGSET